jgi:uncharacterized protein YggU (UPF0235/DUF167 family)
VAQRDVVIEQGLSGRLKRIRIRNPGHIPDEEGLSCKPASRGTR